MLRKAKRLKLMLHLQACQPEFRGFFQGRRRKATSSGGGKGRASIKGQERGTLAFKRGDVHSAIRAYHEALLLTPFNVALL